MANDVAKQGLSGRFDQDEGIVLFVWETKGFYEGVDKSAKDYSFHQTKLDAEQFCREVFRLSGEPNPQSAPIVQVHCWCFPREHALVETIRKMLAGNASRYLTKDDAEYGPFEDKLRKIYFDKRFLYAPQSRANALEVAGETPVGEHDTAAALSFAHVLLNRMAIRPTP